MVLAFEEGRNECSSHCRDILIMCSVFLQILQIASGSYDETVKLWDVMSGE